MPVATAASLPDDAASPIAPIEIHTTAATAMKSTESEANDTNQGISKAENSKGESNTNTSSPAEKERQIKLGLLLVRLGAAKETSVFGPRGLTTPPRDLLVIHRPEDEAKGRRPFKWYDPLSWFLSGPRPSPMLWETNTTTTTTKSPRSATKPTTTTTTTTTAANVIEAANAASAATEVANANVKKKKKARPLPVVNMQPLKDETVLEPIVREEREKLLKDEEAIHRTLDGIEETRYTYLVPSQDLRCESEVISVVRCYEKQNAVARRRKKTEEASKSSTELPAAAEVLQCGPVVELLKRCAEGVIADYSEADATQQ